MSRLRLAAFATCIVAAAAVVTTAGRQPEPKPCEVQGTWKLVAYTWGDNDRYTAALTQTLLYNDTHWVSIAQETNSPGSDPILAVGGAYSVVGDSLHQVRTFGVRGEEPQWNAVWCETDGDVLRFKSTEQGLETVQMYERVAPEDQRSAP